jgi:Ca2+-binding EF-hand superfamily protein
MSTQVKTILSNDQMFVEVAKVAFDSVDTDRSGQIDAQELEKVMSQIANDMGAEAPSKEDVAEVLEHLDTDKSGKISFEEFKVLIKDVLECMLEDEEGDEVMKENTFFKK